MGFDKTALIRIVASGPWLDYQTAAVLQQYQQHSTS
jgi:hypothetical protein